MLLPVTRRVQGLRCVCIQMPQLRRDCISGWWVSRICRQRAAANIIRQRLVRLYKSSEASASYLTFSDNRDIQYARKRARFRTSENDHERFVYNCCFGFADSRVTNVSGRGKRRPRSARFWRVCRVPFTATRQEHDRAESREFVGQESRKLAEL